MGWLTKQMYSRGPGSPGKTCETVVKSFLKYIKLGLDKHEACNRIIHDYKQVYVQAGIPELDLYCEVMSDFVDGNPSITAFIITLSSHNGNLRLIKQLYQDLDTIIEISKDVLLRYNIRPQFDDRMDYEMAFEAFLRHPNHEE